MPNKSVLVTGGSSGMGRATAEHYARLGAHVIMLARSTDKLEQVAHGIVQNGGQASYYAVDLSDAEAVAATAERIESDLGTPDIIINNAGAGRWLPLVETPPEDARQMIELPYLAAFYVTRMFLPYHGGKKHAGDVK
ncbi:MAG TPA: SDR family oxidoreductase, partial [Hyphomicrobiales bacterium]|nr:SDR family oxidoreductase [Hyphomicrobiales bacterium]